MIATRDLIHAPVPSRGSHCVCGEVREYQGHQAGHQALELIPLPMAPSPVDSTFLFLTRGHPLLHARPCGSGFLKQFLTCHAAHRFPHCRWPALPDTALPAPWLDLAPFPCTRSKPLLKTSCLRFRDKQWIHVFFTWLLLPYFEVLL